MSYSACDFMGDITDALGIKIVEPDDDTDVGLWADLALAKIAELKIENARLTALLQTAIKQQPPLDHGLFADRAQMDLADRKDIGPRFGVWCQVNGGITGQRENWLKSNDCVLVFYDRKHAQAEADHWNAKTTNNPHCTFLYTVRAI